MARIQILNLPGDGHPFALVIDQADESTIQTLAYGTVLETDGTERPLRESLKANFGARAILVVEGTMEVAGKPASASTADTSEPTDWYTKIGAVPAAEGATDAPEQVDANAILYGIQRVLDEDDAEGLLMPEEITAAEAAFLQATSIPKPFLWPLAVRIGALLHLANGAE